MLECVAEIERGKKRYGEVEIMNDCPCVFFSSKMLTKVDISITIKDLQIEMIINIISVMSIIK